MIVGAFLSSAISTDNSIAIGKKAPQIETIQGINVVADANSEPKTKVISFWNPKKPASRINNKELSRQFGSMEKDVEFISICTDPDENLMREVMKIDNISADKTYSWAEISPRAFKDYGALENPRAFVISPSGEISSVI